MDFSNITNELTQLSQSALLLVFCLLVALDIVTGYLAAKIQGDFSSSEASKGLMRQSIRILTFMGTLLAGVFVTPALQIPLVTIQGGFIIAYIKSLQENYQKAMWKGEN